MPYQTLGDLMLQFPETKQVENYRRDLNLDTAVATTSYTAGGVRFTREAFASPVDGVIVVRLTADKPGRISFTARLQTPQKATVHVQNGDTLVLQGVNGPSQGIAGALKFEARVRVAASGRKDRGRRRHDRRARRRFGRAPDRRGHQLQEIQRYQRRSRQRWSSARLDAAARNRSTTSARPTWPSISGSSAAWPSTSARRDAAKLPTDERIKGFAAGKDPGLAALYFQYGRYLLISSSRKGGQPATLQGLWNDSLNPPWGSKYTININTEMNYWPAEPANLGECIEPLMAMVEDLTETGARTAKVQWGARGWVAHHNTDLWRAAAPIDGPWGFWPTGGAWLCQNLWEHYEFTRDKQFLARLYPATEGRQPVLPRHLGRGAAAPVARDLPLGLARKRPSPRRFASAPARRWTCRSSATCSPTPSPRRQILGKDEDFRDEIGQGPDAARALSDRQGGATSGVARRLGHAGRRPASPPRLAPLRLLPQCTRSRSAARRNWPPPCAARWKSAATTPPAGASAGG